MCEIPKIPKIYDYNRDKMGITQNEVVWIKNTGGQISQCTVNFAIIAKIQGIAKIQIFAMHSNFLYDSAKFRSDCEIFAMVAKFSKSLRNFCNA